MQHSRPVRWSTALLVMSLLLWRGVALAQQPSIGQVVSLQGQATVKHAGSPQAAPLSLRQAVFQGDVIETLAASKIQLLLVDGIELRLGEQGTMTLSKLVYAPQQKAHQGVIDIARGIFRAVNPKVTPQTSFEVHTATAVAAVRGTRWYGEVTATGTGILVLEGTVAVVHANPRVRGEAIVRQGEGTDVVNQLPPTPPRPWGQARISKVLQATEMP